MAIARRARINVLMVGCALFLVTLAFVGLTVWGNRTNGRADFIWSGIELLYIWFFVFVFARLYLSFHQNAARYGQGDHSSAISFALAPESKPLVAGESVMLQWELDGNGRRLYALFFSVFALEAVGCCVGFVFNIRTWTATSIDSSFPLLGVFLLFFIFFGNFRLIRTQTIRADDEGLHLRQGRETWRTLRWGDILGVVRVQLQNSSVQSDFRLITKDRLIKLDFFPDRYILGKLLKNRVRYTQTSTSYQYDAERLLATLAARSAPPVEFASNRKGKTQRLAKLTIADAQMLPVATSFVSQSQFPVPASQASLLPLAFSSIPDWGKIWRDALLLTIMVSLLFTFLIFVAVLQESNHIDVGALELITIIIGCLICFFAIPLYVWGNLVRYRLRFPKLLATDEGMATRYRIVRAVPEGPIVSWSAFQAWVVHVLPNGQKVYTLYAQSRNLSWQDDEHLALQGRGVSGDRQAAYRERMAQLHALIASRTGLTLREDRDESRGVR